MKPTFCPELPEIDERKKMQKRDFKNQKPQAPFV